MPHERRRPSVHPFPIQKTYTLQHQVQWALHFGHEMLTAVLMPRPSFACEFVSLASGDQKFCIIKSAFNAHWNVLLLSLVKARIQKHCSIFFILRQSMRRQFGLLAVSGVTASGTVGCAIPRCCRHCSRPQRRRKLVENQPQCSQPGPDNHIVLSSDRFDQLPDTKRELEDEKELGSDLAKYSCTQLFSAPLVFFFVVIFLLV